MHKYFITIFSFLVLSFVSFSSEAYTWDEIEELKKTVVNIQVSNSKYFGYGQAGTFNGTGFVVDKTKGLILTNRHVVPEFPSQIKVTFHDGSSVYAKHIYYDAWHDFSIIQFQPKDTDFKLQEVSLGSYKKLKLGDEVLLIGNNESEEYSVKEGKVVQLVKNKGDRHTQTIQTSFDRTGGSSGSPVWNSQKEVVGIHFKGSNTSSFEVPIDYAVDKLKDLNNGKSFARGDVGVILDFITIEDAKKYHLFPEDQVKSLRANQPDIKYIVRVDWVMDTYKATELLEPGDILYKVGGQIIGDNLYRFDQIVDGHVGKNINIEFFRFGKKMTVELPVRNAEDLKVKKFVLFAGGTFHEIYPSLRRAWNIRENGVFLSQAEIGSNAAKIGYASSKVRDRHGSLVTAINGQKVKTLDDLIAIVSKLKDGDPLTVVYNDYYSAMVPRVSTLTLNLKLTPTGIFELNPNELAWQKLEN